uniref:Uncharacterized protein n=1 Tax=Anguilla anguilla TaxID=7936 RepID=A0A0E9XH20_ANGAN
MMGQKCTLARKQRVFHTNLHTQCYLEFGPEWNEKNLFKKNAHNCFFKNIFFS